jgi:phage repressor protein C with HTH and peptisase S24 domain
MQIGARIKLARTQRGVSVIDLANAAGISRQALYDIESGETKSPMPRTLQAIADRLHLDITELIKGESEPRGMLVQDAPSEYAKQQFVYPPVVGTAQLGDDGYWLELDFPVGHGDGFVLYPSRDPNAYAVRCKGDSMRPRIKPGEFAVLAPNHAFIPGDEILLKDLRGRAMIKVFNFERDGLVELASINEDHRPITIDKEQIAVMHYVEAICKASLYYRDIAS